MRIVGDLKIGRSVESVDNSYNYLFSRVQPFEAGVTTIIAHTAKLITDAIIPHTILFASISVECHHGRVART